MNFKTLALVSTLILFGIGAYFISDTKRSQPQTTSESYELSSELSSELQGPEISVVVPAESFTVDEVAQHATKDDCWTIIEDNVYDITSYIPRHPGGSEILRACGVDGSSLFNLRQDENGEDVGSGSPHSTSAADQLASLIVGSVQ